MTKTKQSRFFYGWIIVAACFCLQGGVLGIINNIRGVFYDPVCTSLGFELGDFTLYTTFYGAALIVGIPVATAVLPKVDLAKAVAFCAALDAAAQFIQGYFTKLWQWYVISSLQGFLQAFVFSMVTGVVINNWFIKRKGTMLSISGIASSLIGAVLNVYVENYIALHGWQSGYRFLGIFLFVLMVPAALTLRRTPADMGLKPYGYEETAASEEVGTEDPGKIGLTRKEALRTRAYRLLIVTSVVMCLVVCSNQFMKNYVLHLGYSGSFGATLVSVALAGNLVIKLFLGQINDRFGYRAGTLTGIGMTLAAGLLLLCNSVPAFYVSAFLIGAPMAVSIVCYPVWTSTVFGNRDYMKLFAVIMLSTGASSSIGYSLLGYLIDAFGYNAFLWFTIGLTVVGGVTALGSFRSEKKIVIKG